MEIDNTGVQLVQTSAQDLVITRKPHYRRQLTSLANDGNTGRNYGN